MINKLYLGGKIKNLSILFNAVKTNSMSYGYSYGHGYGDGHGYYDENDEGIKKFWSKKKES